MLEIRESEQGDTATIEALYPEAFPDEDLVPLVRDLLRDPAIAMSLVGTIDSQIAGHVIFTSCEVAGVESNASLLAPLAVLPKYQRQGIGSALVRSGFQRLRDAGVKLVCVLGDPAYYVRFGFQQESAVEPPYRLPEEWASAWQSQYLDDGAESCAGKLVLPPQWLHPHLWAP